MITVFDNQMLQCRITPCIIPWIYAFCETNQRELQPSADETNSLQLCPAVGSRKCRDAPTLILACPLCQVLLVVDFKYRLLEVKNSKQVTLLFRMTRPTCPPDFQKRSLVSV